MALEKINQLTQQARLLLKCIQDALDRGLHATGLFFNLSKAYNVINHDILLDKLNEYGIRGEANLWRKSYFSNCLHFVEIKETDCSYSLKKSCILSCKKVEHGVPQGSVLGPLLFLLYINDITENVLGPKLVLFVDDTNLITGKDEHDQHKIINVMKWLEIWFQKNNLKINTEKIIAMSFHSKQVRFSPRPQTTFTNIKITYQSELRFLEICIMENLTWGAHARSL
jgi:hypothetical protein